MSKFCSRGQIVGLCNHVRPYSKRELLIKIKKANRYQLIKTNIFELASLVGNPVNHALSK